MEAIDALEELTGFVERLTYYSEENGFCVAKVRCRGKRKECAVVGTMPYIQVGTTIHCTGRWSIHAQHGRQFEVQTFRLEVPHDAAGIKKFLESGAVKGIGPAYAEKIVEQFGDDALEVLEMSPERLFEIPKIGTKRARKIAMAWAEHKAIQELFFFLHGYGISRAYARKILRIHGHLAIQKIQQNPYQLAKDVPGIGFTRADEIARQIGLAPTSPERVAAGIDFVLYELAHMGHTCFPLEPFIEKAKTILEVDDALIRLHLGRVFREGAVELRKLPTPEAPEGYFVWSRPLFLSECGIAHEIRRLAEGASGLRAVDSQKALAWVETVLGIHFAPQQQAAIGSTLEKKLAIITGGPGTGKSTITRAIVAIFRKLTAKIVLVAPTGRAAKRLAEITAMPTSTIHRLLKFDFATTSFQHNRDCPLDVDLIIIDESSMLDTYLAYHLLKAIPTSAKVVVIGDAHQLPSVGPGNVLKDLIGSEKVAVTELNHIFRQGKGSKIVLNAHRINRGEMPFTQPEEKSDFFFFDAESPEDVERRIIELVTQTIPQSFGFDPKQDIQVLAPMRKGLFGIDALNHALQNLLTPPTGGNALHGFRVGDKVMQIRNNYSKEVYNGDIGQVVAIHPEDEELVVQMEDKRLLYEAAESEDLVLAYAVSVHKYQGSECPCLVMPVHTGHFKMLTKNLLYTAVTRGKKLVCLVGTKKALAIAVKNEEVEKRHTGLKQALISEDPEG